MSGDPGGVAQVNPLACGSCQQNPCSNKLSCNRNFSQDMSHPVRLHCQHCFCLECIRPQAECPQCGRDLPSVPTDADPVLLYLRDSATERSEPCANCDSAPHPMFFCETCQQPLCAPCRDLTHQARIFHSHQIRPLEESGRLRGSVNCAEHKSPYVLYCQEARKLMCIECFNNTALETRNHFVSIETAQKTCRERLDEGVVLLRSFQTELKDQVEVRKRFLEELKENASELETHVEEKYRSLVEALTGIKDRLLSQIRASREERQVHVEKQLRTLTNIEAPIKLNLLSASVFCSYASQLDLLHLFGDLMNNMKTLLAHKMDKIPFNAQFDVDFNREFAHAMEVELDLCSTAQVLSNPAPNSSGFPLSVLMQKHDGHEVEDSESTRSSSYVARGIIRELGHQTPLELNLTTFQEQLQKVDEPMRFLQHEAVQLSKQLLDIQRDITLRRCLVDKKLIESILERGDNLVVTLRNLSAQVEETEPVIQDLWTTQLDQLRRQYQHFHHKKEELGQLQRFCDQVLQTVFKIKPLCQFLANVISVVDEKRSENTTITPMEQVCMQILTLSPDSKQRCQAIEKEEENRRLAKEREKRKEKEEVKSLPKNLKETPRKLRPVSMVIVEHSRDRQMPSLPTTKRKKRTKRCSQSDESSGLRSPSPRGLFSSANSLETVSLDLFSPGSLSPTPQKESASPANAHPALVKAQSLQGSHSDGAATPPPRSPTSPSPPPPPPPPPSAQPRPKPPPLSPKPSADLPKCALPKPDTPKTPKSLPYGPTSPRDTPSDETVKAREMLLQSIKERVKRID